MVLLHCKVFRVSHVQYWVLCKHIGSRLSSMTKHVGQRDMYFSRCPSQMTLHQPEGWPIASSDVNLVMVWEKILLWCFENFFWNLLGKWDTDGSVIWEVLGSTCMKLERVVEILISKKTSISALCAGLSADLWKANVILCRWMTGLNY